MTHRPGVVDRIVESGRVRVARIPDDQLDTLVGEGRAAAQEQAAEGSEPNPGRDGHACPPLGTDDVTTLNCIACAVNRKGRTRPDRVLHRHPPSSLPPPAPSRSRPTVPRYR